MRLLLPPPSPALRACVVVPVRDEERALPGLVGALDALERPAGWRSDAVEAVLLLNNCRDGTPGLARRLAEGRPWLRVSEVTLPPPAAHVGRARQLLFDTAAARLLAAGRPDGWVASTDADSRPAPDWLVETDRHDARVGAVGGRVGLVDADRAGLAPGVRRLYLLDLAYRRALEWVRSLYDPDPLDPYPRHHQHYGASLAVRAGAYARAGGMPLVRSSEDVALYRALVQAGVAVRHSDRVRVRTSARTAGRASGGLADAFAWWADCVATRCAVTVESAADADARLAKLGRWRQRHAGAPPERLSTTPDGGDQEITAAIAGLRARAHALSGLSLAERLAEARPLARAA